jgi:endonuclease-8
MPEGDTIHSLAGRLGPRLVGHTIRAAASRWPAVADGLAGRTVTSVEARGKHLLVGLDDGQVVRVHLGMNGGWRRWSPGEVVRLSHGRVALRLDTDEDVFVCHDAPTVERTTRRELAVHPVLRRLGPDLVAPEVDLDAVLARIPSSPAPTAAELLLDQDVASGIGNVWKSELLFLHRLDPFAPPHVVPAETWRALYADAHRRMRAAVGRPRNTTGAGRPSERLFVYGRGGRPCLRCGARIAVRTHGGDLPRHTWWCPRCQPRVSNTGSLDGET